MSDVLIDSRDTRSGVLDSRNTPETGHAPTWDVKFDFELTHAVAEEEITAGFVAAEDVEGVPITLVRMYAEIAARHSIVREIEPGVFVATTVGLDGAWGDGATPDTAIRELEEAIIGWVAVKRRIGAGDIPPMEGIDLNPAL